MGVPVPACCCCSLCISTGSCGYRATFTLSRSDTSPTLYVKEDSNATVYRSHTTEGALSQTISSSTQQVIRGDYTADASFRFWWNAPSGLTSSFVRIDVGILNTGTKTVCVNGQNLSPGCEYSIIYSQAVLEAVGARAPDFSEQPSYGGGITWTLTCGCCP